MYKTKREIFDIVKKHLLTQMETSRGPKGCMYRGDNGLKCAIGCLIPDELYNPVYEGKAPGMSRTSVEQVELWKGIPMEQTHSNAEFLIQLQNIHDTDAPLTWKTSLDFLEIRLQHDLSTTV